MTTIIVPFVHGFLCPDTLAAVRGSGFYHRLVDLDPADPGAYGRLFRQLWRSQATFIICEHDVVPTREQLQTLQTCGHDWCTYAYDNDLYPDGPMLGLCRFSSRLMTDHPHAAEVALITGRRKDQEASWWEVDALIAKDLTVRLTGKPYGWSTATDTERATHPWRAAGCVLHQPPVHHAHVGPPGPGPDPI